MAQIPDTFELFAETWRIRTGDSRSMPDHLGLCLPDQREILLNPDQSEQSIQQTLVHELIHSIEQKLHLDLTENQVDLMALGLLDLFKNNPNMLTILGPQ